MGKVRLMTRRRRLPGGNRYTSETLILSDQGVVAALADGDALSGLLRLPLSELRSTRESLPASLQDHPRVIEILDALIGYKEALEHEGPDIA